MICVGYYLTDMTAEIFFQQLRLLSKVENTRILLLTAEENQGVLRKALLVGATDVFNKKILNSLQGICGVSRK